MCVELSISTDVPHALHGLTEPLLCSLLCNSDWTAFHNYHALLASCFHVRGNRIIFCASSVKPSNIVLCYSLSSELSLFM